MQGGRGALPRPAGTAMAPAAKNHPHPQTLRGQRRLWGITCSSLSDPRAGTTATHRAHAAPRTWGTPDRPRTDPPGHAGCSRRGAQPPASTASPRPGSAPPGTAQHPCPARRSVTQQVGARQPPAPRAPPAAPGTYCCRGCRSRRGEAGRGGSAAPCSSAVPALSPLASHNKGGGREAGAAGPGGG